MTANTPEPACGPAVKEPDETEKKPKKLAEEELDKALADSFPASDPPAPAIKGTATGPIPDKKEDGGEKG